MRFHPYRPARAAAIGLGIALLCATQAPAQHSFDGNIFHGNGAVATDASGAACAATWAGTIYNDVTAVNPLVNPRFPGLAFEPTAGSIAAGFWDDVATIYDCAADACDLCGCPRNFNQVCYRGAVAPPEYGIPDWTDEAWICYSGACLPATVAPIILSGPQAANYTMTTGNTYVLSGKVNFLAGTTLTIQPGVVILGTLGAPVSYLVIERGAKINAVGTPAQPIVFTSSAVSPAPGDWGGVVVHGRAVANCADCLGGGSCVSEGGAGDHCGNNDCDDSGTMQYVRVQWAGFELAPNNELNCFTFNSVGCGGPGFHHLQAYAGSDDLFEWFGGKGNYSYLIGLAGGDDMMDWQMGFRGTVQFAVMQKRDQAGSDKVIEADNNEFNFNAPCRSNPLIANVTLVGAEAGSATGSHIIHLRRGTDAKIFNSIIMFARGANSGLRTEHPETCARGLCPTLGAWVCQRAGVTEGYGSPAESFSFRSYPNPVVSEARFSFSLPATAVARLGIYDVSGRLVDSVVDGSLAAGPHELYWAPSRTLAAGTYFYRFESGAEPVTGRLTLAR